MNQSIVRTLTANKHTRNKRRLLITALAMSAALFHASASVKITPNEKGLFVDGGKTLQFTIEYPVLCGENANTLYKIIEKTPGAGTATVKYEGGAEAVFNIGPDGTVKIKCSNLPGDVKFCKFTTFVGFSFVDGGQWGTGDAQEQPFPADKPAKPHLYQGHTRAFTVRGADGAGLTFTMPPYTYNQLTDNREWGWKTFVWTFHTPLSHDNPEVALSIAPASAPGTKPAIQAGNAPAKEKPVVVSVTPKEGGIAVDAGPNLKFTMEYPRLIGADQKEVHKIIEKTAASGVAKLKYEGGGEAEVSVGAGGALTVKFSNLTGDVKHFAWSTLLSFGLSGSGQWKFDEGSFQAFPVDKLPKPHLFQNQARAFTIQSGDGKAVTIEMPPYSYNELTDNREWGWKIFAWKVSTPYNPDHPELDLKIGGPASGASSPKPAAQAIQVDKFGQSVKSDWPDKLKSEDELKADVEADKAYYAGFNPPERDKYGGLPGSGPKLGLKRTGYFHVEKSGERWFLVDPEGNAFFHLGVGCFHAPGWTYVTGRKQIYEWLPPFQGEYQTAYMNGKDADDFSFYGANVIRKYGKPYDLNEVVPRMIDRVRKWGFNSSGPFTSPVAEAYQQASFPYVSSMPMNPWNGFPDIPGINRVWDPFAENAGKKMDELCATKVPAHADDPLLIGYFIVNEPIYEDIPRVVPTLKSKYACKRRLVQMLQEKYQTIEKLNQAWKLQAKSFEELNDTGLPVTTPQASADMKEYTTLFLEQMFKLASSTLRKYDKNHLLIGNRLQYGTINNEPLCRLMGKYLDVVSFNYYTNALDTDFLKKVYKWTGGKPMILSEFYWDAPKESGLPGGVKDVESQEQRGLAYRNYVEQAAALGFIVGVEWFTLVDEPVTGNWFSKYGGENGNTGLIAVTDRPWKKMIAHMVKTNYDIYEVELGTKEPFAYDHPLFKLSKGGARVLKVSRATGPIKLNGSAENWPGLPAEELGSRVVTGAGTGGVGASFKACWDDQNFYFLISVNDPTPMMNDKTGGDIYQGDAVELFFAHTRMDETGMPLADDRHLLLSAGAKDETSGCFFVNLPSQPGCRMAVLPNPDGKGYTLEAAIPFASLGFKPKVGDTIRFDIGLDDSIDGKHRTRQFMWNGTERNSQERSGWGKATFIQ